MGPILWGQGWDGSMDVVSEPNWSNPEPNGTKMGPKRDKMGPKWDKLGQIVVMAPLWDAMMTHRPQIL